MDLIKQQPRATQVEEIILGILLMFPDAFETANDIITKESFYSDKHQIIFGAMQSLFEKKLPIETTTVVQELTNTGQLNTVGGAYFIVKLTDKVSFRTGLEGYCRIVQQKFIQRELIRVSGEINSMAYEENMDVFKTLESAEKMILSVGTKNSNASDMIHISDVLMDATNMINQWRQVEGKVTGVTSGFQNLDLATRGWQNGDLIILGARPSTGKTALALALAKNAALMDNTCVAIWSLEMKAVFLALRMMASESEQWLQDLQTGTLTDEDMDALMRTVDTLSKSNIFFDQSTRITMRSLARKARWLKKKKNLGLIILDYIQLMEGEGATREREIASISRDLKNLAQELNIPIIGLSQITRELTKGISFNSPPPISSLRESGSLEQDADLIMMLWGANDAEILENPELAKYKRLKIAKQRNGITADFVLEFLKEVQQFRNLNVYSSSKEIQNPF